MNHGPFGEKNFFIPNGHGHRDRVRERVGELIPHPLQQLLGTDHTTRSAEAACENLHKALPRKRSGRATTPAWTTAASPDNGSSSELNAVSTLPGSSTVWAVGSSGASGSANPLLVQNG